MNKERKCQACNQIKKRQDLIKITKLNDNTLKINPSSNELGRSMYVCKDEACIKSIIKKKRIKIALKFSNQEMIEKIEENLLNLIEK